MKRCENFTDGKLVPGDSTIPVFNPGTEAEITQVRESSAAEADRPVEAATGFLTAQRTGENLRGPSMRWPRET
jgi:acyl-CoA reductase-like NAD-dependent aldehyde dehydrogenase